MPFLNVCDNVQIYKQLTCSLWLMFRTKRSCSGSKRWQSLKHPQKSDNATVNRKIKEHFMLFNFNNICKHLEEAKVFY